VYLAEEAAVNKTTERVFDNQRKQAFGHYELQRQLLIEKLETAVKHYVDAMMGRGNSEDEMKLALISWYLTARGYFDEIPDKELTALDRYLQDPKQVTMPQAVELLRAATRYNFRMGVTNILKTSLPDELNLIGPMVRR
jgi:hypothetical protein